MSALFKTRHNEMTRTEYTQNIPYMPNRLLETVIVESDDDIAMMDEELRLWKMGFDTEVTLTPDKITLRAVRILTAATR